MTLPTGSKPCCDVKIVWRPGYDRWGLDSAQVADFTDAKRPAIRVGAHCSNCGWKGEARFQVGYKIPLWVLCPKCERHELSAHDGFLGRDEQTLEEEREAYEQYLQKWRESEKREKEIRDEHVRRWAEADKKKGIFKR